MEIKRTDELLSILGNTEPQELEAYLRENSGDLFAEERPFAAYMRQLFQEHGVRQQDVFLKADLSMRYGYRLISEEKRTKQRDYLLRICFAAGFSLEETQRALQIYGMSRLYARMPRDAVLIVAFQSGLTEIEKVDALLVKHGMPPLKQSAMQEE